MKAKKTAKNYAVDVLKARMILEGVAIDPVYGSIGMLPREDVAKMKELLKGVEEFLEKRK